MRSFSLVSISHPQNASVQEVHKSPACSRAAPTTLCDPDPRRGEKADSRMQSAHREGTSGHAWLADLGLLLWLENAYQPPLYSHPSWRGDACAQSHPKYAPKCEQALLKPHGRLCSGCQLHMGDMGCRDGPSFKDQPWIRGSNVAEHPGTALPSIRGRHFAGRGGVWSAWLLSLLLRIGTDRAAIPPPKLGVLLSPQHGREGGGLVSPSSE